MTFSSSASASGYFFWARNSSASRRDRLVGLVDPRQPLGQIPPQERRALVAADGLLHFGHGFLEPSALRQVLRDGIVVVRLGGGLEARRGERWGLRRGRRDRGGRAGGAT